MTAVAAVAVAIATGLLVRPRAAPGRRLNDLSVDAAAATVATEQPQSRRVATRLTVRRRAIVALAAAIAAIAVLGLPLGVVAGGVLGVAMMRFRDSQAEIDVDGGAVALIARTSSPVA